MRTITLGTVISTSLLLALEAVEATSYFSPRTNLAFQPRLTTRYCLVEQDCPTTRLAVEVLRGGASKKSIEEEEEVTDEETDDEGSDIESDVEEEEEEEEDEAEEDEYDAEEYDDEYDEEEEEEEEQASVTVADLGDIVEPYFVPAQLQLYVMLGSMMITRKIDMFNPVVVKVIRFLFIAQLIVQQIFIIYVRIMAKKNNDRTPIQTTNPLSDILQKQMGQQGGNDMVKNLASSFLSSETTVREYDMKQASNMQGGIIFNMAFNWFLHFKMQKTQPLLMQIITGTMQLVYHPLFQVYILGRNLERPFKTQMTAAQKMMEAQKEQAEKGEATEEEEIENDEEEEVEEEDQDVEEEEDEGDEPDDDDDDEEEDATESEVEDDNDDSGEEDSSRSS
ncbi:unnamed protein product [Cylindrotheca closterium]|uniref:Uncharacterized protein n=1 Tax=Cylindrotheca closterium TaxID=2856 RepID=A0AAD2FT10_9STRA|nr:unnamed protein product [Cylindrotheca closterium]